MTHIRKYIELVEGFGYETPARAFGRKGSRGSSLPAPSDPAERANLERCRGYTSAEDYADDNNPLYPVHSGDPAQVLQRFDTYQRELMGRWNHWKKLGYY